jgi:hypothetical protein
MPINGTEISTFTESDAELMAACIQARITANGTELERVVSADDLRQAHGKHMNIELAKKDGQIVGYIIWTMTFSPWRGVRGGHINDQFGADILVCEALLKRMVKRAHEAGAEYVRAEGDITEDVIDETYMKAGFHVRHKDNPYLLEPGDFERFVAKC